MSLEEMILRGELVREPARPGETRRLIAAATRRLEDAANTSIHPETRLEQAYHAILNCALIALRAEGLRSVNAPGKHRFVLESLTDTLGTDFNLIAYFQQLRDLRHRDIYEGSIHVSERDAEDAVYEASGLLEHLSAWLEVSRRNRPRPRQGCDCCRRVSRTAGWGLGQRVRRGRRSPRRQIGNAVCVPRFPRLRTL